MQTTCGCTPPMQRRWELSVALYAPPACLCDAHAGSQPPSSLFACVPPHHSGAWPHATTISFSTSNFCCANFACCAALACGRCRPGGPPLPEAGQAGRPQVRWLQSCGNRFMVPCTCANTRTRSDRQAIRLGWCSRGWPRPPNCWSWASSALPYPPVKAVCLTAAPAVLSHVQPLGQQHQHLQSAAGGAARPGGGALQHLKRLCRYK